MPAQSKAQQRLMGQAYVVKKGDISIKDIDPEYRDKIQSLVDGMTLKQLKDFAETSHEDLPERKDENIQAGSIPGMGDVTLPGNPGSLNDFSSQETGSGDIPHQLDLGDETKRKYRLLTFDQFIKQSKSKNHD